LITQVPAQQDSAVEPELLALCVSSLEIDDELGDESETIEADAAP